MTVTVRGEDDVQLLRSSVREVPADTWGTLLRDLCCCGTELVRQTVIDLDLSRVRQPGRPFKAALRGVNDDQLQVVLDKVVGGPLERAGVEVIGSSAWADPNPVQLQTAMDAAANGFGDAVVRIGLLLAIAQEVPAAGLCRDLLQSGRYGSPAVEGQDRRRRWTSPTRAAARGSAPARRDVDEADWALIRSLADDPTASAAVRSGVWPTSFWLGFTGASDEDCVGAAESWLGLGRIVAAAADGRCDIAEVVQQEASARPLVGALPASLQAAIMIRCLVSVDLDLPEGLVMPEAMDTSTALRLCDHLQAAAVRCFGHSRTATALDLVKHGWAALEIAAGAVEAADDPGSLALAERSAALLLVECASLRAQGAFAEVLARLDMPVARSLVDLEVHRLPLEAEAMLATAGLSYAHHAQRGMLGRRDADLYVTIAGLQPGTCRTPIGQYLQAVVALVDDDPHSAASALAFVVASEPDGLQMTPRVRSSARLLRGLALLETLETERLAAGLGELEHALDEGIRPTARVRTRLQAAIGCYPMDGPNRASLLAVASRMGVDLSEASEMVAEAPTCVPQPALSARPDVRRADVEEAEQATAVLGLPADTSMLASCQSVIGWAREHLSASVAIHPSVIEGAAKLDERTEAAVWAEKAVRALRTLDAYVRAKRSGRAGDLRSMLASGNLEHAIPLSWWTPHESKTTNANGRYRDARTLPVDRRVAVCGRIYMPGHLKLVPGGNPAPRIHLHDDTSGSTGLVHIGHFGDHLENSRTN